MDGFTTQPVAATWGADPEWADALGIKRIFSIGRSSQYTHIVNGDWRSVVLRKPGCIKGKRLIFVPSVRAWIEKQRIAQESGEVEKVDPALSAICKNANRKMQEKKKAEREEKRWHDENPLLAWAERQHAQEDQNRGQGRADHRPTDHVRRKMLSGKHSCSRDGCRGGEADAEHDPWQRRLGVNTFRRDEHRCRDGE